MKFSESPSILFGPYGTRLLEKDVHNDGIHLPASILNGSSFRKAVQEVAREHLSAGAEVASTHTFGLRSLIHLPGELGTYREALKTHRDQLHHAIDDTGRRVQRVFSFGPAGDCYTPDEGFGVEEAKDFHEVQASEAKVLNADAAWFETINTVAEGAGIALAAKKHKVPCVISFVLNKKGQLLSGESAADAIRCIDSRSGGYPVGYGFNCCPIEALEPALQSCGDLAHRIVAAYPNASSRSPEELDGTTTVTGLRSPGDSAAYLNYLAKRYGLKVLGGCCGYNHRDIGRISAAVQSSLYRTDLPLTDAIEP